MLLAGRLVGFLVLFGHHEQLQIAVVSLVPGCCILAFKRSLLRRARPRGHIVLSKSVPEEVHAAVSPLTLASACLACRARCIAVRSLGHGVLIVVVALLGDEDRAVASIEAGRGCWIHHCAVFWNNFDLNDLPVLYR